MAKNHGINYYEASAKSNANVAEIFDILTAEIVKDIEPPKNLP